MARSGEATPTSNSEAPKKLGGNIMNKPIMAKFYSEMLEGENLKTALQNVAFV